MSNRPFRTLIECGVAVGNVLPVYQSGLYDPREALVKGMGNCAARAFFAGVFLLERSIFDEVFFMTHVRHGVDGAAEHAVVGVMQKVPDAEANNFIMESSTIPEVRPKLLTPRMTDNYVVHPFDQGIAHYAEQLGDAPPDYDESYGAVRQALLPALNRSSRNFLEA